MKKIIKNITLLSPGGNNTALVPGINRSFAEKKKINDGIMKKFADIEQVGFVDLKKPELQMAGGEFCGNATRSTVFIVLKGLPGEKLIKVSGANKLLKGGITSKKLVWAEMPIYQNLKIKKIKNINIVPLYGITIVVIERKKKFTNRDYAKKKAIAILKKLKLLKPVPASGVMFLIKEKNYYEVEPVIWVRDIKTLFYETACASGTTGVGLYLAKKLNQRITDLPILQPSGKKLFVSVTKEKDKFTFAKISGEVQILKKINLATNY